MTTKAITFITPPVTLVYPKFETPDVYTPKHGKAGAPKYKTDASFVEAADLAKVQNYINGILTKLFPGVDISTLKTPFKAQKVDGKATGATLISATTGRVSKRTGEVIRPPMFDAANSKLPEGVFPGGGTIARLDLTVNPYKDGINFYLNAVQVLKLEESTYGKSNFEPTEGYTYTPDEGEAKSSFGGGEPAAGEEDAFKF